MKFNRRSFLKNTTLVAGLLGAGLYGYSNETTFQKLLKLHQQIKVPGLPSEFQNYRIGFASDIHLSVFIPDEWMDSAIKQLAEEHVDLLILGGDHIYIPDSFVSSLFPIVRNQKFDRAKSDELSQALFAQFTEILKGYYFADGIIAISGNHDNWHGADIISDLFHANNFHYLINAVHHIKRGQQTLELMGVDDYWAGFPHLISNSSVEKLAARILLAHNPDYISDLLRFSNYKFDLALAGHTHAGQIRLTDNYSVVNNIRDLRFKHGLVETDLGPVLVSAGVGVVEVPYRINCRPEIHVIELVSA